MRNTNEDKFYKWKEAGKTLFRFKHDKCVIYWIVKDMKKVLQELHRN